jgi:mRNA-degrading endonuclease RelE of RelBE toxin-antitoxin system
MSYKVLSGKTFESELKRLTRKYPGLKELFRDLLVSLSSQPLQGKPIGRSCYKIRVSIPGKNKGKSGGGRVITFVHISEQSVFLLSIYDKSERADLRPGELEKLIGDLDL